MEEMWSKVLQKLKGEMGEPSFETWFSQTTGEFQDDTLIVHAQNDFARDWIKNRYQSKVEQAAKEVTGKDMHVEVQSGLGDPKYHQEFEAPVKPEESVEDRVARIDKNLDFNLNQEESTVDYIIGQILALDKQAQRHIIQKLTEEHDLPIREWIAEDKT